MTEAHAALLSLKRKRLRHALERVEVLEGLVRNIYPAALYVSSIPPLNQGGRRMIIGKQFSFDSAHYLPDHPKCGCVHGHTWTLWVELEGPIDHKTGMVADFGKLKPLVNHILEKLDHKLINETLGTLIPTCENLCGWIANELSTRIPESIEKLYVTIQEGKGGYAKYELKLR
jgi:6-pyruvoyltetrahydropterin/6-carboxytetrahydropterin synthase